MQATNGNGQLSVVEAELVRVKRQNAALRRELAAVTGVGQLVPAAYAEAVTFLGFVAYGVSEIRMDAGGRSHAQSSPPPRNPAACDLLRRERSFLANRSRDVRSGAERAAERPDTTAWQVRV